MTRITQDQLDNLLATVTDEKINFAQLLKANGYEANLDKLTIDAVKQSLTGKRSLNFSELSLKETVFKNITNIKDISFVGANLENAAFSKDNKFQNINFSSANLKDAKLAGCAFLGEAVFTSANMLDTNIYAGNIYDLLDEKQQKEVLCLRMSEATHYNAQALNELLESKLGSCQGLVNDYIRYTINGKTGYVDKINRKLSNPTEAKNYFTRINSYQKNLIATVFAGLSLFSSNGKIDSKAISNEQFIESLPENVKNSGAFSFILLGSKGGGHAIAVTAVRNDKSEIIGYKIFDPNLGEIDCSDGKNAAENIKNCNQQINNLIRLYKKNNLSYSRFFVGDLEKPMIALGLVKSDTYKKEDKYLRDHANIKVDLALALSQHNQGFGNLMMKVNRIYNLGRELTLLQVAAEIDLELAAKIAIKRGDDLNKKDYRGMAPLHIAAEKGQLCVMKLLVEAGADITIPEKNNLTPIQIAAKFGKANTFEYLLSAGATPVIPDHDGKHLIHWAAEAGHTKMVMDLIKQGVDPNLPDKNGNTPLHIINEYMPILQNLNILAIKPS